MEVYLDIFLIENFIIDLFLLSITFNLLKYKVKTKRILISAIIGSLYDLVLFFEKLSFFKSTAVQLFIAIVMVLISLGIHNSLSMKIKTVIVFVFNSIILSGICFYFYQLQNSYSLKDGLVIKDFNGKFIIISIMILYLVISRMVIYFKERALICNFIFNIEIPILNITYKIKGFLDTGNELREPITNLPCILVEERLFKNYIFDKNNTFYINYATIGYEGKLKGFKVEKIKILKDDKLFREIDAIICPCKEVLSKERDFNALLSRGVI